MSDNLQGRYRIRRVPVACQEVTKLFPRVRDRMEIRRHALKLAHWPDGDNGSGKVGDLDWEWVQGIAGPKNIGELRIDGEIGGHRNLRVIFHKAEPIQTHALPEIWILQVFPKKRSDFSKAQLIGFKLRRQWVVNQPHAC